MDRQDLDGRRLLASLRDAAPSGPSTVDVHRAIRSGTRRRRARHLAAAVAVAGVTALAAAVIPTVLSGPTTDPAAQPLAEFNVLRQEFGVGSAGGFTPVSYETGRYRQRVLLLPSSRPADERASVTMYARGRLPEQEGARWEPSGSRAPDVNGHRAYWLSGKAELAWEWADGAWALATVDGAGADGRDLAHRVAQSVLPGENRQTQVPFTIAAPPDPYRLAGVITPFGTSSNPADGALVVLDPGTGGSERVLVGVRRDLARDLVTGNIRTKPVATTQLAGHPAAVFDTAVTIFDIGDGWSAVAEASGPSPGQELLGALASSVQPIGSPTGDPIR